MPVSISIRNSRADKSHHRRSPTDGMVKQKEKKSKRAKSEKNTASNDPKFNKIFENLGDGAEETQLRKELLMSMAKPGELGYGASWLNKKIKENRKQEFKEKKGIEEMAEYRRQITMPIGTK
ncbi:hypothetical protein FQA39_LY19048 [Lamprigera yunnana]|nr:hypothetical protein FQA39_LY19048 [Lamprigera yunnana]